MEKLECGCECEVINGKVFWIYCDDHEANTFEEIKRPIKKFKIKLEE